MKNLKLINESLVGRLSTFGEDGYPYTVPVHYIFSENKIYFHSRKSGEKVKNILANSKVCFEIDNCVSILSENVTTPCKVNTEYQSIVIKGTAKIIDNFNLKKIILEKIILKYTPHLLDLKIPEKNIHNTSIIEIETLELNEKNNKL